MAKHVYAHRFKPDFYTNFKEVAKTNGYTVTGAYEDFMAACIETNKIVIPERQLQDYEMAARVLSDWLRKGRFFYRSETGEERSTVGSLFNLIPKIRNKSLRSEVELVLKQSVAEKTA